MIKRLLYCFFAAVALVTGVAGCHTAHGAGEDIQSTGNAIERNTPP